ncbi:XRE family transcriptional regulator [Agathobacter rectalis]|jgi:transcriptional regulator with XRE-family HTH domain|uniref:XRE family transcriptional regulator n=4 Tax=Lachnospiraceae TaxID=186803 RepID=A0A412Q5M8_9FIRM|nr:XRE family transcriptional regulator [Agathobacter rectalis]RGT83123.1 XRE family transcriptional regulator [Agathobacter rectalis]
MEEDTMGEALRLLRIFNGYKSAELAKKLELSQSYVSELENGKKQPTMEVLDKYAKVFEMKKSTLMLFAESLEGEEIKNDKKQRIARAGMKLLKILEKVGEFEDE